MSFLLKGLVVLRRAEPSLNQFTHALPKTRKKLSCTKTGIAQYPQNRYNGHQGGILNIQGTPIIFFLEEFFFKSCFALENSCYTIL